MLQTGPNSFGTSAETKLSKGFAYKCHTEQQQQKQIHIRTWCHASCSIGQHSHRVNYPPKITAEVVNKHLPCL